MIRATLLALALVLGGGTPQLGALLDAVSAGWTAVAQNAGTNLDPNGVAARTDAGNILDPNGGAASADAGTILDPDGAAAPGDAGTILDPNG